MAPPSLLWQVTLASISRNDFAACSGTKLPLHHRPSLFSPGKILTSDPISTTKPCPKAGKTNPQARPFEELVSRPSQRSGCTVILMRNNAAMFVICLNPVSFPKGSSQDDFIARCLARYNCILPRSLQLVVRHTIQAAFLLRARQPCCLVPSQDSVP